MGRDSKIQWCHHTFNPWVGCQRVSEECANCYAAESTFVRIQRKEGRELWGNELRSERHVTSEANWRKPLAWNRAAEEAGERHRVFCASLADVFEDRDELQGPRARLFRLIEETPALDWLLLTKRPDSVMAMVPEGWREGFPPNVWLGTSTGTQAAADERIRELLRCPAAVRFLSCEPLLEPVDLTDMVIDREVGEQHLDALSYHAHPDDDPDFSGATIDWVIIGGESGPQARPCDVAWIRSLVKQCREAGVAAFVKQLGARPGDSRTGVVKWYPWNLSDSKGGDPNEWPEDLRVREFPEPAEAPHAP